MTNEDNCAFAPRTLSISAAISTVYLEVEEKFENGLHTSWGVLVRLTTTIVRALGEWRLKNPKVNKLVSISTIIHPFIHLSTFDFSHLAGGIHLALFLSLSLFKIVSDFSIYWIESDS